MDGSFTFARECRSFIISSSSPSRLSNGPGGAYRRSRRIPLPMDAGGDFQWGEAGRVDLGGNSWDDAATPIFLGGPIQEGQSEEFQTPGQGSDQVSNMIEAERLLCVACVFFGEFKVDGYAIVFTLGWAGYVLMRRPSEFLTVSRSVPILPFPSLLSGLHRALLHAGRGGGPPAGAPPLRPRPPRAAPDGLVWVLCGRQGVYGG